MTTLLKTDFSDAQVLQTDDPQRDRLVLPDGEIPIMYEAGTLRDRNALVIADPTDNNIKALNFEIHNATIHGDREGYYKGRVQLNCALPDVESITMRTRMLLDLEAYRSYPKANSWFTTMELWIGAANSIKPFRISMNLRKNFGAGMPICFLVSLSQRDTAGKWWNRWSRSNGLNRPPLGAWFDAELSINRNGLNFSINNDPIFNFDKWIPTPFTMIQPCKLYTSGAVIDHMREAGQPARILWDSLEIST